jgi:hypothetical protein
MARRKEWNEYDLDIRSMVAEGVSEDDDVFRRVLSKWSDRVPIYFEYARNEKKPYLEEETGCHMKEMESVIISGYAQTGDYYCFMPTYLGELCEPKQTGVFWDRKTVDDFYGTLVYGHDRFKNVCERAITDPRCTYLIIGVEGTYDRFIRYRPDGKQGAHPAARAALAKSIGPKYSYKVIVDYFGNRKAAANHLVWENRMWIKYHWREVMDL